MIAGTIHFFFEGRALVYLMQCKVAIDEAF